MAGNVKTLFISAKCVCQCVSGQWVSACSSGVWGDALLLECPHTCAHMERFTWRSILHWTRLKLSQAFSSPSDLEMNDKQTEARVHSFSQGLYILNLSCIPLNHLLQVFNSPPEWPEPLKSYETKTDTGLYRQTKLSTVTPDRNTH